MAKLVYSALMSLDGYIADENGNFGWAVPDEEVLEAVNYQERAFGTFLYGRTMYELMVGWENDPDAAEQSPQSGEFAELWQSAEKVVYSTTLDEVSTRKTRIEREFDPVVVKHMKENSDKDISVSGPNLATHAFRAGLVDECQMFVVPVSVGGGKSALPENVFMNLELRKVQRFHSGVVYLEYMAGT